MNRFLGTPSTVLLALALFCLVQAQPAQSRQGWRFVSPDTLEGWMRTDQVTLVNVMSRIECLDHRIARSVCIACEQFASSMETLRKDVKLVLYCESEMCHRSCLAADEAVKAGFREVYVLNGGLPAWKRAGYATESVQRVKRRPIPAVKAEELKRWLMRHGQYAVLDIRSREQYRREHLDGAVNIPFSELHERYHELARDRGYLVVDDQGFRSFLASCYLAEKGFQVVRLYGGMAKWRSYKQAQEKRR
ncbi:MAG TPA: rhodanese-like domain-containing protein [Deltaproteobacteria bacterium]|mgnify:CR=1 FL=1|nr:rhodanese-like domain-containing protein [Deltaproteobacteria bacterium]HOM29999.1 rhodanese-like domain-containing protein [Deltaproteobacteria bacterium]HPP81134.1 rhodanese-like domain-containing protein [Deltaproteobacteria bacterium]